MRRIGSGSASPEPPESFAATFIAVSSSPHVRRDHVNQEELTRPWSRSINEVLQALDTDPDTGLSDAEASTRRETYGENRLREHQSRSLLDILWAQLRSLIVLLLAVASLVAFAFGEIIEGIAIMVVIVINTLIGFFTELRAVQSMDALRELGGVDALVFRDGEAREVPAEELVPGDVVKLQEGDLVTADIRLIDGNNLQVDESALTGESVAVEKSVDPVAEDVPIAERHSMVYKGTAITRGEATGVVVRTGMETELGEITELVDQAEGEQTPLERRLEELGNKLIYLTLGIAGLVTLSGTLAGRDLFLMIETGIALAVAAVPEGLPIVATIALARGMWRMAEKNALINRLSAVETLGSTTTIFTDKTGTLTENKMTVQSLISTGQTLTLDESSDRSAADEPAPDLHRLLRIGVLCNNASAVESESGDTELTGDPMETALIRVGDEMGVHRGDLHEQLPEVREEAFSSETKMMATFHDDGEDGYYVAVKGAPEAVLEASDRIEVDGEVQSLDAEQKEQWLERNRDLASDGLRLLAMADRRVDTSDAEPYEQLVFRGFVGFYDPPRSDVRAAIDRAQRAGIRVIMVTGDQSETAASIARDVGITDEETPDARHGSELEGIDDWPEDRKKSLLDVSIFSRVSPKQKLNLVDLHQDAGQIAGMTGDGVNDAPALKKADIGIAMGQRGTQVAQEAADIVLTDDAFSTIVTAIEEGRTIFENIRKFVFYLLTCNVSEIMVVGLASMLTIPLPILPLQILFLNLVTDVFPALALGMGEGDEALMDYPPRDPDEPILRNRHWWSICVYGVVFTVAVLGALLFALFVLDLTTEQAVSISFLTLAFAQLWHVFNMREYRSGVFDNDITRNAYVWGALVLCTFLLLLVTYVPFLAKVLKIQAPSAAGWALVVIASLVPLLYGQIIKTTGTHLPAFLTGQEEDRETTSD